MKKLFIICAAIIIANNVAWAEGPRPVKKDRYAVDLLGNVKNAAGVPIGVQRDDGKVVCKDKSGGVVFIGELDSEGRLRDLDGNYYLSEGEEREIKDKMEDKKFSRGKKNLQEQLDYDAWSMTHSANKMSTPAEQAQEIEMRKRFIPSQSGPPASIIDKNPKGSGAPDKPRQ